MDGYTWRENFLILPATFIDDIVNVFTAGPYLALETGGGEWG